MFPIEFRSSYDSIPVTHIRYVGSFHSSNVADSKTGSKKLIGKEMMFHLFFHWYTSSMCSQQLRQATLFTIEYQDISVSQKVKKNLSIILISI